MISCTLDLPYLDVGRGHLLGLRRGWVVDELQRAASRSGHTGPWWPATQVTEGLVRWLERADAPGTLSLEDLQSRLRHALEGIGLTEVAGSLELDPPPVRVDLLEFVSEAGTALELDYFRRLGEHLDDLFACGLGRFAFVHLDEAVDRLCPQTRRSARWNRQREETLAFLVQRSQRQHAI